jgi:hypothetical protein
MPRVRHLTQKQIKFAELYANNIDHKPVHVLARMAGYNGNNANVGCIASRLLNPRSSPLVYKLIRELEEERKVKISNDFFGKMAKFNKLFDQILTEAGRELSYKNTYRASQLLKSTKPLLNFFSATAGVFTKPIKVYLAEESRPYATGHFKIGMTVKEDVDDRKTYTDNPYQVNYLCYFEYIPNFNFDLETTLHKFFKRFSTNSMKDSGSTEWFYCKNRKAMLKAFHKASVYLLNKYECKHTFQWNSNHE